MGKEIGVNEPFENVMEGLARMQEVPKEGEEICIDHWEVWYYEESGEIVDIEYLGSDCYPVNGGGGNGNNPSVNNPNNNDCTNGLSCEELQEQYAAKGHEESGPITVESDTYIDVAKRKISYVWGVL